MDSIFKTVKCRYFKRDTAKNKETCLYLHPENSFEEKCASTKCIKLHRKVCFNGQECFYNIDQICKLLHENSNNDKTMKMRPNNKSIKP